MTEPPADEIYNPIQPYNLTGQYASENYQSSTYSQNLRNSLSDAIVPDSGYIDNLQVYTTTEDDLELQEQNNSASQPGSRNTPNSLTKPRVGQTLMTQRNKESIRELTNINFNSKYML